MDSKKLIITPNQASAITGQPACEVRAWVKNGHYEGTAYKGLKGRWTVKVFLIPLCNKVGITEEEARRRIEEYEKSRSQQEGD